MVEVNFATAVAKLYITKISLYNCPTAVGQFIIIIRGENEPLCSLPIFAIMGNNRLRFQKGISNENNNVFKIGFS